MSKRSFRTALIIVVGSIVLLAGTAIYVVNEAMGYPTDRHEGDGQEIAVQIESGMSFPKIARRLSKQGIIDKPLWFRLYAMHRGVTTKVRVGDYFLRDDMTPEEVLDTLLAGVEDVTISVTIPEGLNMLEVFDILAEAGITDRAELERLGRDAEFLKERGIQASTIDGYLFPETYRFKVPSKPGAVLDTLIKQHRIVWDEIRRKHAKSIEKQRKKLKWSDHDFVVMASIVEKEAVVDSERPRIAQVFINRLIDSDFVPHRLDTDPTIRYGCMVPEKKSAGCQDWDPSKRLRRAQLDDVDNPYNTYQHEGLPPGPICNPGREALEATASPDGSKFFFFVSRNDGTHVFSRTRAQHERAVDEFQR